MRGPSTVVVTSAELPDTPDHEIETLAVEGVEEGSKLQPRAWRVRTPKLPINPSYPYEVRDRRNTSTRSRT